MTHLSKSISFGIVIAMIYKKRRETTILSINSGGVNEVGALSLFWRGESGKLLKNGGVLTDRRYHS
jgi:hypothetical protein